MTKCCPNTHQGILTGNGAPSGAQDGSSALSSKGLDDSDEPLMTEVPAASI